MFSLDVFGSVYGEKKNTTHQTGQVSNNEAGSMTLPRQYESASQQHGKRRAMNSRRPSKYDEFLEDSSTARTHSNMHMRSAVPKGLDENEGRSVIDIGNASDRPNGRSQVPGMGTRNTRNEGKHFLSRISVAES